MLREAVDPKPQTLNPKPQSQTELEVMLREAVDHVKSDLGLGGDPQNIAEIKMFTKKERESVLEILLSQEKTIR